jgi:hypothetical protein
MTGLKLNLIIGAALVSALSYAVVRMDRCSTVFTFKSAPLPVSVRETPPTVRSVAGMHTVYPDAAADRVLNLGYSSFGHVADNTLRLTPLPPSAAGRATVWVELKKGDEVRLRSPNPKCGFPIVASVFKIDATTPVYEGEVNKSPVFDANNITTGGLLIAARMADGAENNYFCEVYITHEAGSR